MQSFESGGVQSIMINLANGLAVAGYTTSFFVADASGPMASRVNQKVQITNFHKTMFYGDFKVLFSLINHIRAVHINKPDQIITAPGFSSVVGIVAKRLSLHRHKVIVVVDNKLSLMLAGGIKNKICYYLYRLLYKYADEIVVANKHATADFLANFSVPIHNVHTIYNPLIDTQKIANTLPEHGYLDDFIEAGDTVLVSIGRLVKEKDYTNLVDAFYMANLKYPKLKLVIAGTGPELDAIKTKIKDHCIGNNVLMYGYSKNPYELLKRSNIFVLSSRQEAFGGALVEALACGLTVVATDCDSGGPREILDEGTYGYLCPKEDSAVLADTIIRAISVPISPELAAERGKFFSIEKSVKEYLDLIEEPNA